MGTTKSEVFSEEINDLALLFKALGHPARIAIIQFLRAQETCICTDLVNELPLAQPTISQHLKELKNAGIIQGNVSGTSICYCLNQDKIMELDAYLASLKYDQNPTCC